MRCGSVPTLWTVGPVRAEPRRRQAWYAIGQRQKDLPPQSTQRLGCRRQARGLADRSVLRSIADTQVTPRRNSTMQDTSDRAVCQTKDFTILSSSGSSVIAGLICSYRETTNPASRVWKLVRKSEAGLAGDRPWSCPPRKVLAWAVVGLTWRAMASSSSRMLGNPPELVFRQQPELSTRDKVEPRGTRGCKVFLAARSPLLTGSGSCLPLQAASLTQGANLPPAFPPLRVSGRGRDDSGQNVVARPPPTSGSACGRCRSRGDSGGESSTRTADRPGWPPRLAGRYVAFGAAGPLPEQRKAAPPCRGVSGPSKSRSVGASSAI